MLKHDLVFCVLSTTSSRLAQLVERKTLNLVVVGSSPTVGAFLDYFLFIYLFTNKSSSPLQRLCSDTGWMAERSKALVLGTSLFGGVGSNPTPITDGIPISLVGQDTWFSPMRPGFESRMGNFSFIKFF